MNIGKGLPVFGRSDSKVFLDSSIKYLIVIEPQRLAFLPIPQIFQDVFRRAGHEKK